MKGGKKTGTDRTYFTEEQVKNMQERAGYIHGAMVNFAGSGKSHEKIKSVKAKGDFKIDDYTIYAIGPTGFVGTSENNYVCKAVIGGDVYYYSSTIQNRENVQSAIVVYQNQNGKFLTAELSDEVSFLNKLKGKKYSFEISETGNGAIGVIKSQALLKKIGEIDECGGFYFDEYASDKGKIVPEGMGFDN